MAWFRSWSGSSSRHRPGLRDQNRSWRSDAHLGAIVTVKSCDGVFNSPTCTLYLPPPRQSLHLAHWWILSVTYIHHVCTGTVLSSNSITVMVTLNSHLLTHSPSKFRKAGCESRSCHTHLSELRTRLQAEYSCHNDGHMWSPVRGWSLSNNLQCNPCKCQLSGMPHCPKSSLKPYAPSFHTTQYRMLPKGIL